MTEREFIRQNRQKWQALEDQLKNPNRDPDILVDLFTKVSGDLSYARTNYPNRSVRLYLNRLTQKVFDKLVKKKKSFFINDIKHFFQHVLPYEIIRSRKEILLSFFVFLIAVGIGVISTAHDIDFLSVVVGQDYVQMTERNINNGDPMAVYKDEAMTEMFLGITLNNTRVAMMAFIFGLLGGVGTFILLLYNGIMLGAFQAFFYHKGLFLTSFLTIWIHGTIEIASIIIAGGAGFILGRGLLFPSTYSRGVSLQLHAYRALRIILGTMPLFILAGLLEGFVTRHTEWPAAVKAMIIIVSAGLVIYMWIIYPWLYQLSNPSPREDEVSLTTTKDIEYDPSSVTSQAEVFTHTISLMRSHAGYLFKWAVCIPFLLVLKGTWLYFLLLSEESPIFDNLLTSDKGGIRMYFLYSFSIFFTAVATAVRLFQRHTSVYDILAYIKKNGIRILFFSCLMWAVIYYTPSYSWLAIGLFFPFSNFIISALNPGQFGDSIIGKVLRYLSASYQMFLAYVIVYLTLLLIGSSFFAIVQSSVFSFVQDFLSWHEFGMSQFAVTYWVQNAIYSIGLLIAVPIVIYFSISLYALYENKIEARDLSERLTTFGMQKSEKV